MKVHWLHRNNRKLLVIFCSGWGMDQHPFQPLQANDCNVALLYDYRNFDGIGAIVKELYHYQKRILIGWSMGVWGGQVLFKELSDLFCRTVALNGTLCPVDERYGISPELFSGTMKGWSEESRRKFYRRLCGNKELYRQFSGLQPRRTLDDQQQELAHYLEHCHCCSREESIYREVVVCNDDRIVPTASQLAYWGLPSANLEGGHFPFYRWQSWDSLLQDTMNL